MPLINQNHLPRELLRKNVVAPLTAFAIGGALLEGCSITIDSYLTDTSHVQCDDRRTTADLAANGMVAFTVHGKSKNEIAVVAVKRRNNEVSVAVGNGATTLQALTPDQFSMPVPIVSGPELSAMAAGGAWTIDAREKSVVIEGNCTGQQ